LAASALKLHDAPTPVALPAGAAGMGFCSQLGINFHGAHMSEQGGGAVIKDQFPLIQTHQRVFVWEVKRATSSLC
jgi:hypothetical protein